MVKIYNPIPNGAEEVFSAALLREYEAFCISRRALYEPHRSLQHHRHLER